jgi:hypothetical protein
VRKRLSNAFDVIQQPDLATHELHDLDRHRIGAMPGSADVEESLHRQYRIDRNMTDPTLMPRLLEMSSKVKRTIAVELEKRKMPTPRGGSWHPQLVKRIVQRLHTKARHGQ